MPVDVVPAGRRERLLAGFDLSNLCGVEIGPLNNPLVHRRESDVYYVDHASTEDLHLKFADDPTGVIAALEQVDFVWGDKPMVELIGDKAPLDYIVASHVIEHVPDLSGWLHELSDSLKVGGRLLLVVPDKRFTFDIFRPLCSLPEIREAATEQRKQPSLRLVVEHFASVVKVDSFQLWRDYSFADDAEYHHEQLIIEHFIHRFLAGHDVDVHCWVFTPWHFLRILGFLVAEMGLKFDLRYFLTTQHDGIEFFVQLEKVDTPSTDWGAAADEALTSALWPPGASQWYLDGTMPETRRLRSELYKTEAAAQAAFALAHAAPHSMLQVVSASWRHRSPGTHHAVVTLTRPLRVKLAERRAPPED